MGLFGFKSKNAVFRLVKKMKEAGMVAQDRLGRLIPAKPFGSIKVLGVVEAGFPSPAEEELVDTITLDDYLIENKESTFMLTVKGRSMIDAGIMPGDLVLVERNKQPRDGDIVIAQVDHDWTMKYFRKKGATVSLVPGNKDYPIIIPKEELVVAAVVKAVVRKY